MTRRKDYRGETRIFKLHLQRFAEGGDAGGTEDGSGESTGQVAAANTETKATFEELIKGEYKADFEKSIQKAIGRRMSGAKANEQKLAAMQPIMQALASKYGVSDANDIASIAKYVDEDESLYEDAAYKAGMSVDQYKRVSMLEAENQRLNAEKVRAEQRQKAQEQYEKWVEEAEQVKAEFPNFDLNTMLQNESFQNLLRAGVDLKHAYVAMDADNIIPDVMGYTAQQVAKKTAATIAQRGNRPVEGGMSGQAASKTHVDVSKLTDAEIEEYVRRSSRGEMITF